MIDISHLRKSRIKRIGSDSLAKSAIEVNIVNTPYLQRKEPLLCLSF